MKRVIMDVGTVLLVLGAASAHGESPPPKLSPDLEKLDVWVGNWTLS
ncbi:MAG TPA: hypothetical protein VFA39_19115 [Steroidobacteraceae bacterium]|nr:hypothetical protein [Steroidobacteraceae bacterium]